MSNYTKQISWSGKDALSDSDPEKVISGGDFDTEFSAVQTAINSKIDGGTITNFTSTGIDDNATSTAITIDASENVGIGTTGIYTATTKVNLPGAGIALRNDEAGSNNNWSKIQNKGVGSEATVNIISGSSETIFQHAGGISFNGDTSTANALDDYEEGTWTPATSTSGYTITSTSGYYTKVGNIVSLTGQFTISVVGTNNAAISLTGLPYTSAAITNFHYIGVAREVSTRGQMYVAQVNAGQSDMGINAMDGVVSGDNKVLVTDKYSFNVTYRV